MWKKSVAFISIGMFSAVGGWAIGGIAPAILLLMNDFNTDLNATVDGALNWSILLLGVGVKSFSVNLTIEFYLGTTRSLFWYSSDLYHGLIDAFCDLYLECSFT
jgi:hypothetical protein